MLFRRSQKSLDNSTILCVVSLEDRVLLSGNAFVQDAQLFVTGTDDADLVEVRQIGNEIQILVNQTDHGRFEIPETLNIRTLSGDDEVRFQAGISVNTIVYGGQGNDLIRTGSGNDFIYGGSGDDRIYSRSGNDNVVGNYGNDTLLGQGGDDRLEGAAGNDRLVGGAGNDQLVGGAGNDLLLGQAGNDALNGSTGDDFLAGGNGNDIELDGSDGNDIIYGNGGDDLISGGNGSDSLNGGAGNDLLFTDQFDTVFMSPGNDTIEQELENAPDVFNRTLDPNVGAIVTTFNSFDPQDPNDPFDILTNWNSAVDELAALGVSEVTFAVFRNVQGGVFSGGPTLATVQSAVEYANEKGLSVTVLPLFEANGWRGNYDPTGSERAQFRSEYKSLISQLAMIEGIDRFSVGSELNAMVNNVANHDFFFELIDDVRSAFASVGNTTGRVGYTANFDAYDNPQHVSLLAAADLDYLGISAYISVIDPSQSDLVSGTGPVSDSVFEAMVNRWNAELDRLSQFGVENNIPILIQEFGAVQSNYTSVAPFAVSPGDWVGSNAIDRYESDANEQAATYQSLIHALDGRRDDFESVVFWTWEHGASRGERSYEGVPADEPRYLELFAIWPTDGGAGEALAEFLATEQ